MRSGAPLSAEAMGPNRGPGTRPLAPIPTLGLTLDDLPALIEQCQQQMRACIDSLDAQLEGRA